jgi:hypothetical protein
MKGLVVIKQGGNDTCCCPVLDIRPTLRHYWQNNTLQGRLNRYCAQGETDEKSRWMV